jgi:hypothetical protein
LSNFIFSDVESIGPFQLGGLIVAEELPMKLFSLLVIMVDIFLQSHFSVEDQLRKSSWAAKGLWISVGQECKEELLVIVRRAELATEIHLIAGSNFSQHFFRSAPSGRGQTRTKVVIGSDDSDRLSSRCKDSDLQAATDEQRLGHRHRV